MERPRSDGLPLEGVRVLDLCVILAGTSACMVLADMGAEVIRVEPIQTFQPWTRGMMARPPKEILQSLFPYIGGFPNREPGERPWNRYPLFQSHSKNKLSMTVDLKQPSGMDIFKRLVGVSDVIVDNNVPETMDKLGINYEMTREIKADIVHIRAPAFGDSGPYRNHRAMAMQVEAFAGHDLLRGYPDMDPSTNTQRVAADAACGGTIVVAALMALHYRNRTGKGQYIDIAMAESFIPHLRQAVMDYTMNSRIQRTIGNRDPSAVQGCYRCKGDDRWVNITIGSDEEWEGFCRAAGNPPWTREEKFADALSRYQNHDELDARIEEWTLNLDHYEVMHALQEEGIAAAPVLDSCDAYEDPQFRDRGFFEQVVHEDCGTYLHPGVTFRMSKTPLHIRRGPVRLGEDNEYIYRDILKVSDEEYAELEKQGHIGMDYPSHVF